VEVSRIGLDDRTAMMRIVERYYRGPESGLEEELRFGDRVYLGEDDEGTVRAFLVVHLDHRRALIAGQVHRFTYLGLGCAYGVPMVPVFRRAKADFSALLAPGEVGVMHLTTRTPFAFRGLQRAFEGEIYPAASAAPDEPSAIAADLKANWHRHAERAQDEQPFVLRELKKGRFTAAEVERIRGFQGANPLARFGVDCQGADEVIAFHRFVA
jgi:hypothetical protein